MKDYEKISEVLNDSELASLGDTFINFIYAVARSIIKGKPLGGKVRGSILAAALKKAGLREYLPSRMSKHSLANASEAFVVYAWLKKYITLKESVYILTKNKDPVNGFTELLKKIHQIELNLSSS
jgi:hypothetical protein